METVGVKGLIDPCDLILVKMMMIMICSSPGGGMRALRAF